MTDMMGLSDPEKKAKPMSPKLVLIFAVAWSGIGIVWSVDVLTDITHGNLSYLHLVLSLIYLALAVVYWVMWAKYRRRAAPTAEDDDP